MSCLNFKTFVLKYRYSNKFKTIFLTVYFIIDFLKKKKKFINKNSGKPVVSGKFPDNLSLTDHTVCLLKLVILLYLGGIQQLHTGCGSHFRNPAPFNILKKPLHIAGTETNKRHLRRKPLISAFIWHPESGRGHIRRVPCPLAVEKLFLPHVHLCFLWQGGVAPSWSCHALKLSIC